MTQGLLDELASALRIVIVNGPRQSGKTTMLRQYQRLHGGTYRTLDNRQDADAAIEDPVSFAPRRHAAATDRRGTPRRRLADPRDQDDR
jgi:predicted AAA+ superfamily ATPase